MLPYRRRLTVDQRIRDRRHALSRKPDHVPVIVERGGLDVPAIDREKYLIPSDLTCAQFTYVIRRRLRMAPSEALFLMCNNRLLQGGVVLSTLYPTFRDPDDGFLYVQYTLENAFG